MNQFFSTTRTVPLAWQRYLPLNQANVLYGVPSLAGVYKIAVNFTDGTMRVAYVGQAANLAARLKDHLGEWEENQTLHSLVRRYQCSFAVAAVPWQADRNAAERALYRSQVLVRSPNWHDRSVVKRRPRWNKPAGPLYFRFFLCLIQTCVASLP